MINIIHKIRTNIMRTILSRKGQVAMEQLFTYSIVLLTISALGGLLYIYGSGESKNVFPPTCEFLAGLTCIDSRIDTPINNSEPSIILINIRNEMGFDIGNISISIEGTCDNTTLMNESVPPNMEALQNLESATYQFTCPNLYQRKVTENIIIDFTNIETDTAHRKTGELKFDP